MIRAAVIFLALVLSADAADLQLAAFLDSTRLIENDHGQDGRHGERGAYGILAVTWSQHMGVLPFDLAREERWGRECARRHIAWLQRGLTAAGVDANAFNVALAYNAGLDAVLLSRAPVGAYQHAARVSNLYLSQPTK